MQKFNKIILVFIFFFIGIFTISKVFALEVNWPTSPFGTDLTVDSKLVDMVKYFYEWGIAIGGIAVLVALIIGGFLYLTSAGDPGRLREAKDRIFSALTGLALLLGSWLILNTINPELTVLRPPTFEKPVVGVDLSALARESGRKSCEYIRIYSEPYWTGNTVVLPAETNANTYTIWDFKSVRFYQYCDLGEICQSNSLFVQIFKPEATTSGGNIICDATAFGDVNGDCVVNQTDIDLCKQHLGQDWDPCEFSPFPSPNVDDFDVSIVQSQANIGRSCCYLLSKTDFKCEYWAPGDVDGNCTVDNNDITLCGNGDLRCDFNGNGSVDLGDIWLVISFQGKSCSCYKEGGACVLEVYGPPGWWGLFGPCGDKMGNVNSTVHNIRVALQTEKEIHCYKLSRAGIE